MTDLEAGRKTASNCWALTCLALSMLLSSLGVSIANVALPTLTHAFAANYQGVQWVVLSYLLSITVMIVSVGRLGDMLDHRRVLMGGIALFTFASFLCAIAPTLCSLIAARALQGLGAAALMAVTVALVRDIVPKEKTGSAMGLLGTTSAIGTTLGPSLGGVLLAGLGWRAIFFVMLPFGIANFILARRFLPAEKPGVKPGQVGFDIPGTLMLAISLAAFALSMTINARKFDHSSLALLAVAVVAAGLFIFIEAKVKMPLIKLSAFKNMALSGSLAINIVVATVMMATLVVGPFFLSTGLGLTPAVVGLVMSIGPAISTLSGIPAGRIVDRLGAPNIVIAGLFTMTLGSFALYLLPSIYGLTGYIAAMAILTPGYQLFQAANNTGVMLDIPIDQRGVISGMLSLSRNLGLITGASVMGAIFSIASGASDIKTADPAALAHGMRVTLQCATIMLVVAFAIAAATQFGAKIKKQV